MPPETTVLFDETRKSWSSPEQSRPLRIRVWPSPIAGPAGVVLLSHGTGGAAEDLDWLARPLNEAGFLVASVDHHGNSYNDEYLVEGFTLAWNRPKDMSFLLDHLIREYNIDTNRIGGAGFSFGGYTIAALLGARIDAEILHALIQGHIPAPVVPEFPDMMTVLRSRYSDAELADLVAGGGLSVADPRIRAGVLLAPAIGRLLIPKSLGAVAASVLIRWGDADDNTPPEDNAHVYRDLMSGAQGSSVGADVGHYVFLGDRDDPTQVRTRVADDIVEFFAGTL